MEQQTQKIEKIFRNAFEQHTMKPSAKVLRQIKFKLWKADFFSLKPHKLNVVYSTIILGSAVSLYIVSNKHDIFSKSSKSTMISSQKNLIEERENNTIALKSEASENSQSVSEKDASSKIMLSASFDAGDARGCVPYTVHFKNESVHASSYNWEFGDGNKSNYKDPTYTYTRPGNYRATLTVKSKEGNTGAFSKEIKVLKQPEAYLDIDIDKSEISSKKVVFKNLSKEAKSYEWDFGDGKHSKEKEVVHTYSDFGNYKVTLIAENIDGCVDTAILKNNFIEKNYELEFPFSFRPNMSDPVDNGYYGSSDSEGFIFYPKNYGTKIYELKIFAPNGMEVFNTTNIQQGWNGYIKGRLAPAGNYNYVVKGIYPNGKPFDLKGSFKVIVEDFDVN